MRATAAPFRLYGMQARCAAARDDVRLCSLVQFSTAEVFATCACATSSSIIQWPRVLVLCGDDGSIHRCLCHWCGSSNTSSPTQRHQDALAPVHICIPRYSLALSLLCARLTTTRTH